MDLRRSILTVLTLAITQNSYGLQFTYQDFQTECDRQRGICQTQLSFKLTAFSGGQYGDLSLGYWLGTDQYFVTSGPCGLINSNETVFGEKGYIGSSSSAFTGCYFQGASAWNLMREISDPAKSLIYSEREFKGEDKSEVWPPISSDVSASLVSKLYHHMYVSAYLLKVKNGLLKELSSSYPSVIEDLKRSYQYKL